MKNVIVNVFCMLFSTLLIGQTSQFTGTGSWFNAGSWNNGIPTATTNVTTNFGANPMVDGVAVCNDISLFLSSLTITTTGQLTIFGEYSATTTGTNQNDGTLILKGTLRPAIGNGAMITVGNGGGVTLECGLTFSNYSIDRTTP